MKNNTWLSLLFTALLSVNAIAETPSEPVKAPLFDNLGSLHIPVTTQVEQAQRYFDQGMTLFYGFEWGESIRSFQEAARLDPQCVMCYWGVALATGSKINAPISGREYQEAQAAIQQAISLKKSATPVEQAYIQALALRFQHPPKKIKVKKAADVFRCHVTQPGLDSSSDKELRAYVNAMKRVTQQYPDDPNAKSLYAYAVFEMIHWGFWDANHKIHPMTPELIKTLQSALKKEPLHVGANHYLIHVVESEDPEVALESANRLKTLVPGSEHLVHMPTHIYLNTGRYHDATESNLQAVDVFKDYIKACSAQGSKAKINYLYFHNYDFLRTTATFEGRQEVALKAARDIVKNPFPKWLANEMSLQWFIPIPYYVEARFGLWKELLNEPMPAEKYEYAVGMWHYARGVAFANVNQVKEAKQESLALNEIIKEGPTDGNLQKNGLKLLKIANYVLKAVIADREGQKYRTLNALAAADRIQHDMGYHEPPDWYFPLKLALGDAYLKWGNPQAAIKYYQEDLKQYPDNAWSLYGLVQSYKRLGNKKEVERAEQVFKEAWKYAEIPVPLSLFPVATEQRG